MEQNKPLRKPSEMTMEEDAKANDLLPEFFYYNPGINVIECSEEDSELPLKNVRQLLDYLTSINVDPYGE